MRQTPISRFAKSRKTAYRERNSSFIARASETIESAMRTGRSIGRSDGHALLVV